MDQVDLRLLELLQQNGRISQQDLAKAVGLSAPAVGERLRKLEERRVIQRYAAVLDPAMLGLDILAFVSVGISGSRHFADFRKRVRSADEILECHSVTGEGSHLLKIRVADTAALEALLAEIQGWPGVHRTSTSIVLSTMRESSNLPLPEIAGGSDSGDEELSTADLLHVPFRRNP